jgi:hypothetical protein
MYSDIAEFPEEPLPPLLLRTTGVMYEKEYGTDWG